MGLWGLRVVCIGLSSNIYGSMGIYMYILVHTSSLADVINIYHLFDCFICIYK